MSHQIYLEPGEGSLLNVIGERVTCKVVGEETEGAWSLFEVSVPPGGGPPPHSHDEFDEAYYVLEGELELLAGERKVRAVPGSFITIPRGTVHAYRNNTDATAKFLAWGYPSGVERFFAELDREVRSLPPDVDLVMGIAARHNVRFAPPAGEESRAE
jgi:quercetin dioxygenase-like cupin family protein